MEYPEYLSSACRYSSLKVLILSKVLTPVLIDVNSSRNTVNLEIFLQELKCHSTSLFLLRAFTSIQLTFFLCCPLVVHGVDPHIFCFLPSLFRRLFDQDTYPVQEIFS